MTRTETPQHPRSMSRRSPLARACAGLAGVLLLAVAVACEGGAESESAAEGDSTGIEGLSPEQLQEQAQPMSREQAEQLGIVDTTEAAPPAPVAPGDTAAPGPAATPVPPAP
jgi:hypothetical protein